MKRILYTYGTFFFLSAFIIGIFIPSSAMGQTVSTVNKLKPNIETSSIVQEPTSQTTKLQTKEVTQLKEDSRELKT